jgi:hypothetical protein
MGYRGATISKDEPWFRVKRVLRGEQANQALHLTGEISRGFTFVF